MTTQITIGGGSKSHVSVFVDSSGNIMESGGGSVTIHGSGANSRVTAGNGNDTISIAGKGTVQAGNGTDSISIGKTGYIAVGSGADTLTLQTGGEIFQSGASGMDTINIGTGSSNIFEQGHATVVGTAGSGFGHATIAGGDLMVSHSGGTTKDVALTGNITISGAQTPTEFVARGGNSDFIGKSGNDTFVGGSGSDTMKGAGTPGSTDSFLFLKSEPGGTHVVQNFVSGDKAYLEGYSLKQLENMGDVQFKNGNTIITLDSGATQITIKGFTLTDGDVTQKAPKH